MKKKIVSLLIISVLAIAGVLGWSCSPVYAANGLDCNDDSIPESIREASGCDGSTGDTAQTIIINILQAVIGVAGLVAVVFIVIGGVSYMTSAGDVNKLKKAKDTILYAVIGLIICALAFAIVNWTIGVIQNSDSDKTSLNEKITTIAFLKK